MGGRAVLGSRQEKSFWQYPALPSALPRSLVSFGPTDRRKRTKTFLPLLIRHIWFSPPRSLEISSGREKDRGSRRRVWRGKQWIDSCRLQRQLAWKWMEEVDRRASRTQGELPLARAG